MGINLQQARGPSRIYRCPTAESIAGEVPVFAYGCLAGPPSNQPMVGSMDPDQDITKAFLTSPPELLPLMEQALETTTDRSTGRPTKLTPEIQRRLCDALRAGNTREAAASYAGIARSTFYNWLERGRNPRRTTKGRVFKADKGFLDFLDTVTRAENEAEVRCVAVLQKAAHGWPVKKTTTRTEKKIIGKTKAGRPLYGTETATTVVEYTEYDWRAALEWLQRRYPKRWGLRLRIEQIVEDELTEAMDRLEAGLDRETYEAVLALISEGADR